jgi:hypothetical protein
MEVQEALHLFQDMHWAMYATVQFTVTSESSGMVDCCACKYLKNISISKKLGSGSGFWFSEALKAAFDRKIFGIVIECFQFFLFTKQFSFNTLRKKWKFKKKIFWKIFRGTFFKKSKVKSQNRDPVTKSTRNPAVVHKFLEPLVPSPRKTANITDDLHYRRS